MQKEQLVTIKLSINGFKLIRPIAKKTRCRVKLLRKVGLPFVFNRYRRRKAFYAGAILFVVLIYTMTSFVWSVEISGNKRLQTSKLENALAQCGIRAGALKYRINTDSAVTTIMLNMKDISWISIVVRGTKVRVDLRERIEVPAIIPKNVPCDIVALKDGLIKQVIATEGVEAVGEGDTVKKGQLLISGKIPMKGENNKFRLVHAMGTVAARTWYEEQTPVKLTVVERLRTGRVIKDRALMLFSWKVDILNKKNKFKEYASVETRKKLSIGNDLVFPVELVTVSYYEEKLVTAYVNEKDAKEAAVENAFEKAKEQLLEGATVIKKNVKFIDDEDTGRLMAKVTLECVEDIGTSKQIGGN